MKTSSNLVLLSVLLALMAGCLMAGCSENEVPTTALPATVEQVTVEQANIAKLIVHPNDVYSSGQPEQQQFEVLQLAGVKHIVNLRPVGEQDWDEGALVESLGMQYHSIPVPGAQGVTTENARTLDQLLESLQGEPVLVHCGSGNRIGALVALAESEIRGSSIDEAIAKGKRWGLTRLEPAVREKLTAPNDDPP